MLSRDPVPSSQNKKSCKMFLRFFVLCVTVTIMHAGKQINTGKRGNCYQSDTYCKRGRICPPGKSCSPPKPQQKCRALGSSRREMCYRPVLYCQRGYICIRWKKYTQCRKPFTGPNCKEIVNLCQSEPCLNGGTCISKDASSYTCACAGGWQGQNCKDRDACSLMPCQNGGTCTNIENLYTCNCNKGWSGQNCTDFTGNFTYEHNMLILWNPASRNIESKSIYLTTNTSSTVEISTSENLNASLKNDIDQIFFFTSEHKITLPAEMQGNILQKESKGVKIRSTDPITVLLLGNDPSKPDDGSLIFPSRPTAGPYYSYYMIPSTVSQLVPNSAYSTVFGVIALKDNTTVFIEFQIRDKGTPITFNGQEFGHLEHLFINLNSMETLQIGHNTDLTGTIILSLNNSKAIEVFSGSGRNLSPDSPGNQVMEKLHPYADLDLTYIVPPDFWNNGTFIQITFPQYYFIAPVHISKGASTYTVTIGSYAPYEMSTLANETTVIVAEGKYPVQVINYVKQNSNPNTSNSYMVNIPGVHRYKSRYLVPIPDGYLNSYITVMIRNNSISDLRLNDQVISPDMVRFESKVLVKSIQYSIATVEVSPGRLNIDSTTDSPFGLIVRGYGVSDAYGFTGNVVDPLS